MQQKSASCHTEYQNCPPAPRHGRIVFPRSFLNFQWKGTSLKYEVFLKSGFAYWRFRTFARCYLLLLLDSLFKSYLVSLSALHNREGTVKWNCTYWKQFSPECLDYSDYLIYKLPLQVIRRMSRSMWKMWVTAGIGTQIISYHFKETPPEILLQCYLTQKTFFFPPVLWLFLSPQ